MKKVIESEDVEKKLDRAVRSGLVKRYLGNDWFKEAVDKRVLSQAEADLLRETERLVSRVVAVDDFDPIALEPHYTAGKPSQIDIEEQSRRSVLLRRHAPLSEGAQAAIFMTALSAVQRHTGRSGYGSRYREP